MRSLVYALTQYDWVPIRKGQEHTDTGIGMTFWKRRQKAMVLTSNHKNYEESS